MSERASTKGRETSDDVGIRETPQEPGAVEFVQPGAKKAGDRISLPGGWYYERANDDGVIFVPRRPDGRGFGFEGNGKGLAVTVAQDFAKAMWSASLSKASNETFPACDECSGIGHTGIDGGEVYDCAACLGEGHLTPLREAQYKLECLGAEFDQAVGTIEARNAELSDISAALGTTRFMDPPDGGDVPLAEQVKRMREALTTAERQRDEALEALRPFAKAAEDCGVEDDLRIGVVKPADVIWESAVAVSITYAHVEGARSALENGPAGLADATNDPPTPHCGKGVAAGPAVSEGGRGHSAPVTSGAEVAALDVATRALNRIASRQESHPVSAAFAAMTEIRALVSGSREDGE